MEFHMVFISQFEVRNLKRYYIGPEIMMLMVLPPNSDFGGQRDIKFRSPAGLAEFHRRQLYRISIVRFLTIMVGEEWLWTSRQKWCKRVTLSAMESRRFAWMVKVSMSQRRWVGVFSVELLGWLVHWFVGVTDSQKPWSGLGRAMGEWGEGVERNYMEF